MSKLQDTIQDNSRPGTTTGDVNPGTGRPGGGGAADDMLRPDPDDNPAQKLAQQRTQHVDKKVSTDKKEYDYKEIIKGKLKSGKADGLTLTGSIKVDGEEESAGVKEIKGEYEYNKKNKEFTTPDGRRITGTDAYKHASEEMKKVVRDAFKNYEESGSTSGEGPDKDHIGEGHIQGDDEDDKDKDDDHQQDVDIDDAGASWLKQNLILKKNEMETQFAGMRDLETRNIPSRLLSYAGIKEPDIGQATSSVKMNAWWIAPVIAGTAILAYLWHTEILFLMTGLTTLEDMYERKKEREQVEEEEPEVEETERSSSQTSGQQPVREEDPDLPQPRVEQTRVSAEPRSGAEKDRSETKPTTKDKTRSATQRSSTTERNTREL